MGQSAGRTYRAAMVRWRVRQFETVYLLPSDFHNGYLQHRNTIIIMDYFIGEAVWDTVF